MAKRYTDSNKFRDSWYRQLKPKNKCIWEYMLAECSIAGFFEIDYDSMKFHIGDKIEPKDLEVFKDRIFFIEDNLVFIPKFIQFQQPKGLSRNNKAHNNIYIELEKYSIPETLEIPKDLRGFKGASKTLPRPPVKVMYSNGKGKGNSKHGEFKNVKLTEEEYSKLQDLYQSKLHKAIDLLDTYIATSGKSYKSHYAVMVKSNNWVYKEVLGTPSQAGSDDFDKIKERLKG